MLFMVLELFKDSRLVGERFKREGRMLPEDVNYQTSWMEVNGARCYQIMEAPSLESLMVWVHRWDDLVDIEVIPVLTSQEYWSAKAELA